MCRMVQIRQGLGTSRLFVTANPSDVALPTQSGSQEVSLVTRVSGFPSAPGSTFRQLSPRQWSSHMGLSWACLGARGRMWILVMKILKLFAQELRGLFFYWNRKRCLWPCLSGKRILDSWGREGCCLGRGSNRKGGKTLRFDPLCHLVTGTGMDEVSAKTHSDKWGLLNLA